MKKTKIAVPEITIKQETPVYAAPIISHLVVKASGVRLHYRLMTGPCVYVGVVTGNSYKVSSTLNIINADPRDLETKAAGTPGLLELVKNRVFVFERV